MSSLPKITIERRRTTPIYNIGMASQLTGIPIYTLRWIEQHELISPERTRGNQRLFSDEDIDLIQEIRKLMEADVNLPGIKIILKMRSEAYGPQNNSLKKDKKLEKRR
jgi:MerR family transcriptional regulator, glutamine synthetase repressor